MAQLFILGMWLIVGVFAMNSYAQPETDQTLFKKAEKLYQEKSYALALNAYQSLEKRDDLSSDQRQWVAFRLQDCTWRNSVASKQVDSGLIDSAVEALIKLADEINVQTHQQGNEVWAMIHESLGDSWQYQGHYYFNNAWPYYQKALDWWAKSTDIEKARKKYLIILSKLVDFSGEDADLYPRNINMPISYFESAANLANTNVDKAKTNLWLAKQLSLYGDIKFHQPTQKAFEQAFVSGKETQWFDEILFNYANRAAERGQLIYHDNGSVSQAPDYEKAVELYQLFLKTFKKGESRFYGPVKTALRDITKESLNVSVPHIYLPETNPKIYLNWRNVSELAIKIYPIDLAKTVNWRGDADKSWIEKIKPNKKPLIKHVLAEKTSRYFPQQKQLSITDIQDKKLAPGSYLVEVKAGGVTSRDVLLISDAAVITKTSGDELLVSFNETSNGKPIANAKVTVVFWDRINSAIRHNTVTDKTNSDGLVKISLDKDNRNYFVVTQKENQVAYANSYAPSFSSSNLNWKIYLHTDRPGYRPGETVNFKVIARQKQNNRLTTPKHSTLTYKIYDGKNAIVQEGTLPLNEFGSAWGKVELKKSMSLGLFRIEFRDASNRHVGAASFVRLEEYKLPEFKVAINVSDAESAFQLGDEIPINIQAAYYFGGPVIGGEVEVIVYQRPYYHYWHDDAPYHWYQESKHSGYYGGLGDEVARYQLSTDAKGQADFKLPTSVGNQNLEYTFDVRVVDSSRREIRSQQSIKVSNQPYFVQLEPKHNIYQPGETVEFAIKTVDVNNQPVSDSGKLRITKEFWKTVWLDKNGQKQTGMMLPTDQSIQARPSVYQVEEIVIADIKTDKDGRADYQFIPKETGFYKLTWVSHDKRGVPIKAEVGYFVMDDATQALGYQHGGMQIIMDKESYSVGDTAQIMLSAPTPQRHVLFSVAGDTLMDVKPIYMDGTVKLLTLNITEEHTPNSFLELLSVNEHRLQQTQHEFYVPPEKQFLQVELTADQATYEPGEMGKITVKTQNYLGNPIATEVSLALVDESVYAIQADLSGDIRQFFYGEKRYNPIRTASTFNQKSYFFTMPDDEQPEADDAFKNKLGMARDSRLESGIYEDAAEMSAEIMPSMSPEPMLSAKKSMPAEKEKDRASESSGENNIIVRNDFRSTAFWQADVQTDTNGLAVIEMKYPDSLTTWKAHAKAITKANELGEGQASTITQKPLMARLQAPRFFVTGDEVIISGVINNYTDQPLSVKAELLTTGVDLLGYVDERNKLHNPANIKVTIEPNSEKRIDWKVKINNPGEASFTLQASAGKINDAMAKTYPIFEHGIEKLQVTSGKIRGDGDQENVATIEVNLPKQRKVASTQMEIQVTPSIAITMLDALPYLIDYPYGCVEQTMSRFLPTVIVADTLTNLGIKQSDILNKAFGGIEPEFADKTHEKEKQDIAKMQHMLDDGMQRLISMQHSEGGWGWWKGGPTDLYMSAYVVWGLALVNSVDSVRLPKTMDGVLHKGQNFLRTHLVNAEKDYALQAWMLHALAVQHRDAKKTAVMDVYEAKAFENLWQKRDKLNTYGRALLALSAHYYGLSDQANILVGNLQNGVKRDSRPDQSIVIANQQDNAHVMLTAHWGEDNIYWHWSDGAVETTSFALMALVAIDPKNELVEPVMNWLTKNRRGNQWSSTKDTSIVVLAFNDYLAKTKELASDVEFEILVNGKKLAEKKLKAAEIFQAPSRFTVDPTWLSDSNQIEIRQKNSTSDLYFSIKANYFSLEEPIAAVGNEIFLNRYYFQQTAIPTLLKGHEIRHQWTQDKMTLQSGDSVESVVLIEGKNHYEYLMIEDHKPAGLEAVSLKSGQPLFAKELKPSGVKKIQAGHFDQLIPEDYTGRTQWVYQELRDEKVVSFIDKLPEGYWELRYSLRTEIPGYFHALPAIGQAMYVPEIKANSDEVRLNVSDK